MTVHIKNGRVIDPRNRVDAKQDVFMADGKIAALGKAPAGFRAERAIAADGLVVCPGLIDLSARLREPGFEYKATLASPARPTPTRRSTSRVWWRCSSTGPRVSISSTCIRSAR